MPEGQPYAYGNRILGQFMDDTDYGVVNDLISEAQGRGYQVRGGRVNLPDLRRLLRDYGTGSGEYDYLADIIRQAQGIKAGTAEGPDAPEYPPATNTAGYLPPAPPPSPTAPSTPGFTAMSTPDTPGGNPGVDLPAVPGSPGSPGFGFQNPDGSYRFGNRVLGQFLEGPDYDVLSAMLDYAFGEGFGGVRGGRINLPDLRRLYDFLPDSFEFGDGVYDRSYLADILGQAGDFRMGGGGDDGGGGEVPAPPAADFGPPAGDFPDAGGFDFPAFGDGGANPNPLDVFASLTPFLEDLRDRQVWDSLAEAGYTGNRYSTSAQRTAAEIGGRTGLEMQAALSELLYNTFLANQGFSLQALGLAPQLALAQNSIDLSRLGALQGFGQFEQGRADDIAQILFNTFNQNQYGLLPLLLQGAFGGSQTPSLLGIPGVSDPSGFDQAIDLATLLAQLFGLFD